MGVLVTAMERAEVTTTGGEGRHLMAEVRTGEDQILEEVEVPPATSRVTGEAGLLRTQGVQLTELHHIVVLRVGVRTPGAGGGLVSKEMLQVWKYLKHPVEQSGHQPRLSLSSRSGEDLPPVLH